MIQDGVKKKSFRILVLLKYVENAKPNKEPTKAVYIHNLSEAILLIIS